MIVAAFNLARWIAWQLGDRMPLDHTGWQVKPAAIHHFGGTIDANAR